MLGDCGADAGSVTGSADAEGAGSAAAASEAARPKTKPSTSRMRGVPRSVRGRFAMAFDSIFLETRHTAEETSDHRPDRSSRGRFPGEGPRHRSWMRSVEPDCALDLRAATPELSQTDTPLTDRTLVRGSPCVKCTKHESWISATQHTAKSTKTNSRQRQGEKIKHYVAASRRLLSSGHPNRCRSSYFLFSPQTYNVLFHNRHLTQTAKECGSATAASPGGVSSRVRRHTTVIGTARPDDLKGPRLTHGVT